MSAAQKEAGLLSNRRPRRQIIPQVVGFSESQAFSGASQRTATLFAISLPDEDKTRLFAC